LSARSELISRAADRNETRKSTSQVDAGAADAVAVTATEGSAALTMEINR
jgi:hypothetical protein